MFYFYQVVRTDIGYEEFEKRIDAVYVSKLRKLKKLVEMAPPDEKFMAYIPEIDREIDAICSTNDVRVAARLCHAAGEDMNYFQNGDGNLGFAPKRKRNGGEMFG